MPTEAGHPAEAGLPASQSTPTTLLESTPPPRKRRKRRIFAVVAIVVVVLIAIALVVAEILVRDYVEERIASEVRTAVGIAQSEPVTVQIDGFPVLAQVISGTLDHVTLSADNVDFGGLSGPVSAELSGLPIDGASPVGRLGIRFSADEDQLAAISPNLSGLPIDDVSIAGDVIDVRLVYTVLGLEIPIALGLEPRADAGQLAFTPQTITVADAEFTADELADRFGPVAESVLQSRDVCIAQYLPEPFTLQDARISGDALVLSFEAEGIPLTEQALTTKGRCPAA